MKCCNLSEWKKTLLMVGLFLSTTAQEPTAQPSEQLPEVEQNSSKCETIYNGVVLQSYSLVFANVIIFEMFKYLFEVYILPFLLDRVVIPMQKCFWQEASRISELNTVNPINNMIDVEMNSKSKQVQPTSQPPTLEQSGVEQSATGEEPSRPVSIEVALRAYQLKKGRTFEDTEPVREVSSIAKIRRIFLAMQGVAALYSFVYAFILIEKTETAWTKYQNLYGFLLNSAFLTFCISLCLHKAEGVNERSRENEETLDGNVLRFVFFGIGVMPPLWPPIFTHVIPAFVIYFWIIMMVIVPCYLLFLCARRHIRRRISALMDDDYGEKVVFMLLKVNIRVVMILFFQTFYTYMVLFYEYDANKITGSDYIGVVQYEYHLRSQSLCNFNHALDSTQNKLVFFSWL